MNEKRLTLIAALLLPGLALAAGNDDPTITKIMIDQLELRNTDGPDPRVLDAMLPYFQGKFQHGA